MTASTGTLAVLRAIAAALDDTTRSRETLLALRLAFIRSGVALGFTLEELGAAAGISRQRVQQITGNGQQ